MYFLCAGGGKGSKQGYGETATFLQSHAAPVSSEAVWAFLKLEHLVPPDAQLSWPQLLSTTGAALQGGPVAAQPWQLRGEAVHSWRAHRERVHCAAVCPHEQILCTAARSTSAKEPSEVIQCDPAPIYIRRLEMHVQIHLAIMNPRTMNPAITKDFCYSRHRRS